jgi:hypothetical protein
MCIFGVQMHVCVYSIPVGRGHVLASFSVSDFKKKKKNLLYNIHWVEKSMCMTALE